MLIKAEKSVKAGFWGGVVGHLFLASALSAEPIPTYTLYGTPGLIDMPTAQSADDAELAVNVSTFKGQVRNTITFQITPRLSGSFRYATIDNYLPAGERTWDRSFDLRYRFIDEGRYRPAVAIGLQDFLGTGLFSGEYIVATKSFAEDRLTVTAGIGWGRLGSYNSFSNPFGVIGDRFKTRPGNNAPTGGQANFGQWFRGPAALFGGISYEVNDKLTFKAEYSSDAYTRETTSGLAADRLERKSPINFGINYRYRPGVEIAASFVHGSEFALGVNFTMNPRKPARKGTTGPAPFAVKQRPSRQADPGQWTQNWVASAQIRTALEKATAQALASDGMELVALELNGTEARVQFRNLEHDALPEAIGHAARLLTALMPASVEVFKLEPVIHGFVPTTTTLRRSDMETLENVSDSTWTSFTRARFTPGGDVSDTPVSHVFPRLSWGITPDVDTSFFDPDKPIRLDLGLLAEARYDIAPGWSVTGSIRQSIVGNLGGGPPSNSVLPHVRTDGTLYAQTKGPVLEQLTADYLFKASDTVYGRLSAGYLEPMYGGVSGELLWKPLDSQLAFGVELNYVAQRDFDQRFGFQNYRVATGHVSAYYEFGNGFHGQLDMGRYLAGDWGATLSIDREFKNGWRVGAFATKTNVSSTEFGEGSFDKGIRLEIPLTWALGKPTRRSINVNLRPIQRDGGARLYVNNRLYEQVREYHKPALRNKWGRFWR